MSVPVPFTPMQPVLVPSPFDSPDYLFQVKWDGIRIVAVADGDRVRLFNRHGQERTPLFPELQRIAGLLRGKPAIVDGELIALVDGKPSFQQVMSRATVAPARAASLVDVVPVYFMAFDLVEVDGRDLIAEPLEARGARLRETLREDERVRLVDTIPERGVALFEAVRGQGLEGIVAKRSGSPYVFGKTDRWKKAKCLRRLRCRVVGYRTRGSRFASLLLGTERDGVLTYIGHAGSGITAAQAELLMRTLPRLEVAQPAFAGRPERVPGTVNHYIRPVLAVEVEFLEWTSDLRLRAPVIKGFPPP